MPQYTVKKRESSQALSILQYSNVIGKVAKKSAHRIEAARYKPLTSEEQRRVLQHAPRVGETSAHGGH